MNVQQGCFRLQFRYAFTTAAASPLARLQLYGLACSLLKPSPGQEEEFISPDLHQLKLLWSSILGDHGAWKNALLSILPRELVSGSPCTVEDRKFAETSKFLQSVSISTNWYLLRTCFSGKLPTALLSGRKQGKREEKTLLMHSYTKRCFQLRKKKKKKSNICPFNSGDLEQRGTR